MKLGIQAALHLVTLALREYGQIEMRLPNAHRLRTMKQAILHEEEERRVTIGEETWEDEGIT